MMDGEDEDGPLLGNVAVRKVSIRAGLLGVMGRREKEREALKKMGYYQALLPEGVGMGQQHHPGMGQYPQQFHPGMQQQQYQPGMQYNPGMGQYNPYAQQGFYDPHQMAYQQQMIGQSEYGVRFEQENEVRGQALRDQFLVHERYE
jgi:hypothetical protein